SYPDRNPTVTVPYHAVHSLRGGTTEENRRMGFLRGFRIRPQRIEVDKLAVIFSCFLGPDFLHRLDSLTQDFPALVEWGAVIFHLLGIPATTNAEDQASVGELINRGHFLSEDDRIALND